jgi:hypothetical protein
MDVDNIIQVVGLPAVSCIVHAYLMPHRQLQPSARLRAPQKAQSLRLQPFAGRLEAAPHPFSLVLGKRLRACHHWHFIRCTTYYVLQVYTQST